MHLVLPYSMVEPIRELLESGVQSDRSDIDQRWLVSLRDCLLEANVTVHSSLVATDVSVREVNALKAGEVIQIDPHGDVIVKVEGVGLFRGGFGVSSGKNAIRIKSTLKNGSEQLLLPAPTEQSPEMIAS